MSVQNMGFHVSDHLQKTVDLTELGALFVKNPATFILHTQSNEKIHRLVSGEDILLFTIVGQISGLCTITANAV